MEKVYNETKILKWIILLPIAGVIITSFILTNIFISSKYEAHHLEIEQLKENHISNLKEKIKERIEHVSLLLDNKYKSELSKSMNSVRDIVDVGHTTLVNIYHEYHELPRKRIFPIIDDRMKSLRFFENKSGYYFIYDLEDGISISLPSAPQFVGKSLKNLIDKNGKNLFDSYGKILDEKGEGFDYWYWNKPGQKEKLEKVGYIKKLEPLNIGIGTAVYLDDIKADLSKSAISFMNNMKYEDNGYIFVFDSNGTVLHHINKDIINLSYTELPAQTQKNAQNIISRAKSSDGSFIEYFQAENMVGNDTKVHKISYVKHIKHLDWVIGTGLYTDSLNKQIELKHENLSEKLNEAIAAIMFASLVVTLIVIFILILLSKRLKNIFQYYSQSLEESNKELEKKVQEQVKTLRTQDVMLNQQSKFVAMGEMLGNIAHQWRQPLSSISTLASGIKVHKDMDMLNDKMLDSSLTSIVSSTQILSSTIDDFRDFYSQDKEKTQFNLNDVLKKVESLISANLNAHNIKEVLDIKEVNINSYENELIQVLLNVFNNAKDALENKEHDKYIFLNGYKNEDRLVIEIYDNAGGIKENIINRIFEPYFTTKFKSQGTGIGLYMTKNIIENSLNGSIEVSNKEFIYDDKEYKGALFIIKLPLDIE